MTATAITEATDIKRAGLAIVARTSGRVLMIQRADRDPQGAGGRWEFPGGRPKAIDAQPFDTAKREWTEEVGLPVPDGDYIGSWVSSRGFAGFIIAVPAEFDVTPTMQQQEDVPQTVTWVDPDDAVGLDLRSETMDEANWNLIRSVGPQTESVTEKDIKYGPSDVGLKKGKLRYIEVDPQIPNIDRQHYQRRLNEGEVHDLVHKEGPKKIGKHIGLLAERDDRSLWVVDGQHHTMAAIVCDIPQMPYYKFDSDGWKHEKDVYERLSDWRKGVGLKKSVAPYVRASFANGWAEAGEGAFPLPPHAAVLFAEAVSFAAEYAGNPSVLEAVRRDARINGIYTMLDRRKDALERKWRAELAPIMRTAVKVVVPQALRKLGIREDTKPPTKQDIIDAVNAAFETIADSETMAQWADVLTQASADAAATGMAHADAYIAHRADEPIPSPDLGTHTYLDAMRAREWDVSSWIGRQTQGLSYSLGGRLADAIAGGAQYGDLLDIADSVIGDDGGSLALDQMLNLGIVDSAMSQYSDNGVTMVDLLTSPNACPECEDVAAANSWALDSIPDVPIHPNCRCDVAPAA